VSAFLELSFPLGALDAHAAQAAAELCGAAAVTFMDAGDEPVLEPAPGEVRLWRSTQVSCLFGQPQDPQALRRALAAVLGIEPAAITATPLADRPWEREWLKDWHALRFGRRLWICPTHEQVADPDAVVVTLDPGLAFGTGTHPSTALCLEWLDAHFSGSPAPAEHSARRRAHGLDAHMPDLRAPAEHFEKKPAQGLDAHLSESLQPAEHSEPKPAHGLDAHLSELPQRAARVIDYGCGSGVLGLAAGRLGASEVHAFDIDPQALTATAANAAANGLGSLQVHTSWRTLPGGADVLLANILAAPLCSLVPRFAALVRPGGQLVLAGLMAHEEAEVTGAYAACFDVRRCGDRDDWIALAGPRRLMA
jgi:ribosomal protein L11 methylase PrmA